MKSEENRQGSNPSGAIIGLLIRTLGNGTQQLHTMQLEGNGKRDLISSCEISQEYYCLAYSSNKMLILFIL